MPSERLSRLLHRRRDERRIDHPLPATGEHPHTSLPRPKEPNFFTLANPSARQWRSYRQLFAAGPGSPARRLWRTRTLASPHRSPSSRQGGSSGEDRVSGPRSDSPAYGRTTSTRFCVAARRGRWAPAPPTPVPHMSPGRCTQPACRPTCASSERHQVLVIESERMDEPEQWARLERFLALPHEPLLATVQRLAGTPPGDIPDALGQERGPAQARATHTRTRPAAGQASAAEDRRPRRAGSARGADSADTR